MTIDDSTLPLVRAALAEDVGSGDVTTESTIPEGHVSRGTVVAKEAGIVAGLGVAAAVFAELSSDVSFERLVEDGDAVVPGDPVATVTGPTRAILTGERVALNFLQHLSGVATTAAAFAERLAGSGTTVLDTRKTTPGMRSLEKEAVRAGGGGNHRMGLWDMVLIKDNHIAAAGGIAGAVASARAAHPKLKIEVEATSLDEVAQAVSAGADRVMLDNMSVEEMRDAIALARAVESPPEIEVSGGVTDESLAAIATLGAEFVSVGALTHSVKALDLSLELEGSA